MMPMFYKMGSLRTPLLRSQNNRQAIARDEDDEHDDDDDDDDDDDGPVPTECPLTGPIPPDCTMKPKWPDELLATIIELFELSLTL
jgi:hypothetical protein